jgi:hypothetical protein
VSNAVDDLNHYPKPNESSCPCPTTAHRPEEAPKTKREQPNIDDDKAEATILADQPSNERGWWEHCPKPPNVLFHGVKCLYSYQRSKGCFETSHR